MPRESGYDSMNVCAFCIEMLQSESNIDLCCEIVKSLTGLAL